MAQVGTITEAKNVSMLQTGIEGTGDNAVVLETPDVSHWTLFTMACSAGAWDVQVSLDGTTFIAAQMSMSDQGATSAAPVIVAAAGRVYSFTAAVKKIRISQNSGTAVEDMQLRCSQSRR